MKTILSEEVESFVDEYAEYLVPLVSLERRKAKLGKMQEFLLGIGDMMGHRVCMDTDLGQHLNAQGKPLFSFLKRVNYQDESRFQWAISYIVDEEHDTVIVIRIMPAMAIKH